MPRVLVVDDDESILRYAARALRDAGYEVVVALNGPKALRIVEAQRPFDVFVVDVLMPQTRGDELAQRILQADPDAKVLYFTGYSDRLFEDGKVSLKALPEAVSLVLFGQTHGPRTPAP